LLGRVITLAILNVHARIDGSGEIELDAPIAAIASINVSYTCPTDGQSVGPFRNRTAQCEDLIVT